MDDLLLEIIKRYYSKTFFEKNNMYVFTFYPSRFYKSQIEKYL
jgi:hypothetical protein